MELFKFTLPSKDINDAEQLYFRTEYKNIFKHDCICLDNGMCVSFDTFFNLFSYRKYLRYTNVKKVICQIECEGQIKIELLRHVMWKDSRTPYITELLDSKIDKSTHRRTIALDWDFSDEDNETQVDSWNQCGKYERNASKGVDGFCFIRITALNDNVKFYGGGYYTDDLVEKKYVNLAIGICTYRREEYVKRNVEIIRQIFDENDYLKDNVQVYIVDNAGSLEEESIANDSRFKLIRNKNYGGSGGFTRALIEAWYHKDLHTHILFLDDDIVIEKNVIPKIYNLLSILNDDSSDAIVGGAMLHLDNPYYQFEMGSKWNGKKASSLLRHNVAVIRNLLENELGKGANYNGWYCCCMPLENVDYFGLPFPFFIKADDIEYGVRSKQKVITMNGIGIFHENYIAKYSSHLSYFNYRNKLVVQAIHQQNVSPSIIIKELVRDVRNMANRMRYDECEFLLLGIEHYLKGIEFFLNQEEDILLGKLLKMRRCFFYTKEELESKGIDVEQCSWINEKKYIPNIFKPIIKFTFNGNILPHFLFKKGIRITKLTSKGTRHYSRCNEVLQYSDIRDKYMYTKQDTRLFMKIVFRLLWDSVNIFFRYKSVSKQYVKNAGKITSLSYWEKHLGIDQTNNEEVIFNPSRKLTNFQKKIDFWKRIITSKVHRNDYIDLVYGEIQTLYRRTLNDFGLKNRDMKEISNLKDKHKGKKCFVVCTGPSLTLEDIEHIKNDYSIGVNSIYNIFPLTDWRPTYYTMIDASGYRRQEKQWEFKNYAKEKVFLNKRIVKWEKENWKTPKDDKIVEIVVNHDTSEHVNSPTKKMKVENMEICTYDGCTVTNTALDLAMYMGFSEIYILGVNHDYSGVRHFIPTEDDTKRKPPTDAHVKLSESGYEARRIYAEEHGIKIYNATKGGKLEVFERKRDWDNEQVVCK